MGVLHPAEFVASELIGRIILLAVIPILILIRQLITSSPLAMFIAGLSISTTIHFPKRFIRGGSKGSDGGRI